MLDLFNEPVWGHSSPAFNNDLVLFRKDVSCISSHRAEGGVDQISDVLAHGLGRFGEDARHEKADKILFDKRSMAGTM